MWAGNHYSSRLVVVWILQLWAVLTHAVSLKFTYPADDDMTFFYMNTIAVQYESNFSSPLLYTFCRIGNGSPILKFINETAPNNATAFIPLTMTTGTSCWFNLRSDDTDHSQGFNSVNWDYEINAVNQTTVGLTTVGATTSLTASPTTSTTASTTASGKSNIFTTSATSITPTASSTQSASTDIPSGGLSVGAQAGIGAGVGVAALAAIVAIVALVLRHRRKQHGPKADPQHSAYSTPPAPSAADSLAPSGISMHLTGSEATAYTANSSLYGDQGQKYMQSPPGGYTAVPQQMQELDGRSHVHELPGH